MALPARVKSLDEVDEGLHEHYAEKGGEFVLDVSGLKEHPTVVGLHNAHDRMKTRNADLSEKVKAFGDLTPEDVEGLQEELETLRSSKGSDLISAEDLAALKDSVKELGKKAKRADELEGEIQFRDKDQSTRLRKEIRGALASSGARDDEEALDGATALIEARYKARYERGEEGFSPVVTGELDGVPGDHSLEEFVSGWLKGPGAFYAKPSGKGGSGADPHSRSTDTRGGTKQLKMQGTTVRASPEDILDGKAEVVRG